MDVVLRLHVQPLSNSLSSFAQVCLRFYQCLFNIAQYEQMCSCCSPRKTTPIITFVLFSRGVLSLGLCNHLHFILPVLRELFEWTLCI